MDYDDVLERLLHDESAEPRELPLSLLRAITNDFAHAQRIGLDGFFDVYKGVLPSGRKVAVKKLSEQLLDDDIFDNEVGCFMRMRAEHKNIVRLLGFCADTQKVAGRYEGNFVLADRRERLLCFEYPSGGSLDAYITDASHGLSWTKRYKIIKGICEGLYYLHRNLTLHLNLKPANIWLDGKKAPKISDLSLSKQLDESQGMVSVNNFYGTMGYMPPDYLSSQTATTKSDIYSLGVLITEMLTGTKQYSAVDNILGSWADRFGTSLEDTRLEQIRVCAEIAQSCLEQDPEKRPDAEHIIEMLVETESTNEFTEPDETEGVDEFTEYDAQVSLSRMMEATKPHLLEFGRI